MPEQHAVSKTKELRFEATVVRCGCGRPWNHAGAICPTPKAVDDLGTVVYWHSNPLRRLLWWLTKRR